VLEALGFELVSGISAFKSSAFGKAYLFDVTQLQISSSEIRRKIAQNMSIKYLVPDAVQQIICNNRFYS
jgi:nicotinate-nucleotide adenylyltransferase